MSSIKISSLWSLKDQDGNIIPREITLLPYTRKVSRAYKAVLLKWVNVDPLKDVNDLSMIIPVTNQMEAEEVLVKLLSGLTDSEIDGLLDEEYTELAALANSYANDKKKS